MKSNQQIQLAAYLYFQTNKIRFESRFEMVATRYMDLLLITSQILKKFELEKF